MRAFLVIVVSWQRFGLRCIWPTRPIFHNFHREFASRDGKTATQKKQNRITKTATISWYPSSICTMAAVYRKCAVFVSLSCVFFCVLFALRSLFCVSLSPSLSLSCFVYFSFSLCHFVQLKDLSLANKLEGRHKVRFIFVFSLCVFWTPEKKSTIHSRDNGLDEYWTVFYFISLTGFSVTPNRMQHTAIKLCCVFNNVINADSIDSTAHHYFSCQLIFFFCFCCIVCCRLSFINSPLTMATGTYAIEMKFWRRKNNRWHKRKFRLKSHDSMAMEWNFFFFLKRHHLSTRLHCQHDGLRERKKRNLNLRFSKRDFTSHNLFLENLHLLYETTTERKNEGKQKRKILKKPTTFHPKCLRIEELSW